MISILKQQGSFEKFKYPIWKTHNNFQDCYLSPNLCEAISSILFSESADK